jgi:hypothetical protein
MRRRPGETRPTGSGHFVAPIGFEVSRRSVPLDSFLTTDRETWAGHSIQLFQSVSDKIFTRYFSSLAPGHLGGTLPPHGENRSVPVRSPVTPMTDAACRIPSWPTSSPLGRRSARDVARVDCEEVNRRMKDKAAHACHALCRARIVEDMRRRRGTATAEPLKFVRSKRYRWATVR